MQLTVIKDIYDLASYELYETDDLLGALASSLGSVWPENARLFHEHISEATEITPKNERDIERLMAIEGDVYCVVAPEEAATVVSLIIAAVAAVAAIVIANNTKVPSAASRNMNDKSSNNKLSGRSNEARPMERVPDIFGEVTSYPDLISPTYDEFVGNVQVENQLLCIGRGQYDIHKVQDGETRLEYVSGASVEIYQPNTDIVRDEPYYRIGAIITDEPWIATRSNNIDGLDLRPGNTGYFNLNGEVRLVSPNAIELKSGTDADFTNIFYAGEKVTLYTRPYGEVSLNAVVTSSSSFAAKGFNPSIGSVVHISDWMWQGYDLSGIYTVTAVNSITATCQAGEKDPVTSLCGMNISLANAAQVNPNWNYVKPGRTTLQVGALCTQCVMAGTPATCYAYDASGFTDYSGEYEIETVLPSSMFLKTPSQINPNWSGIANLPGGATGYLYGYLTSGDARWSNTFILDDPELEEVWLNIIAAGGLYKDNGEKQTAISVEVMAELTPIDANNTPAGEAQTFTGIINGSAETRSQQALTMKLRPGTGGRQRIRVRRVTDSDTGFSGSVVDDIKWRDCYAMKRHPLTNWGDVTVVRARTLSTVNATALKERKLNCMVTRQLPVYDYDGIASDALISTRSFADILIAASLDPYIGRRRIQEMDLENIFNTETAIIEYFGTPLAAEFCGTLDSTDLSFEETVSIIARAVFCTAYRQGSILRLFFEREEDVPALLFNHRNKVPGSEKRTLTFGMANDNDGVELEYVSPVDDTVLTMYLPQNMSAVNPLKVETVGVRNKVQAHFRLWREYQRLKHQHVSTEFDGLSEAQLLVRGNKILVANNTKAEKMGGEVVEQNGLVAYSSQPLLWKRAKPTRPFCNWRMPQCRICRLHPALTRTALL